MTRTNKENKRVLPFISTEKAVYLLKLARKDEHQMNCVCQSITIKQARVRGREPRFGCRDLRKKILRSKTMWRECYSKEEMNK